MRDCAARWLGAQKCKPPPALPRGQRAIIGENRRGLWLSPHATPVPVNSHMVGRSRNRTEPVARLRDPGGSGHSVAQLLCGLDDRLCLRRERNVLARISKCRCAKCERKRDAHASDRPAANATRSTYCFHDPIIMRLRISRKPISALILGQRSDILGQLPSNMSGVSLSRGNVPGEDW